MKKYFKPYLYGVSILTYVLSMLVFSTYEINFTMTALLIIIIGLSLDMVMVVYSHNKSVSLQGAVGVLAAIVLNPATALLTTLIAFTVEIILMSYVKKEKLMDLNFKRVFNADMHILCIIISSYLVQALRHYNIQTMVIIFIIAIVYNIINIGLLHIMISILTDGKNKIEKDTLKQNAMYIYLYVVLVIIMYHGYKDYGNLALIILFMFLAPIQSSLLRSTVSKEMSISLFKDALTGAYNRASLNKSISEYLNLQKEFTIVFLDFNKFKNINDNYGHDVGDNVLIHFVHNLVNTLRKEDKLYRFGGDEFVLLLDNKNDIDKVIEKLNGLKDSLVLEIGELKVPYSFSIGAFEYTGGNCNSIDEVIEKASKQMKVDKNIMYKEIEVQESIIYNDMEL